MKNIIELSLRIPEPKLRPGDKPDFSGVEIPKVGHLPKPPIDADVNDMREHAFGLIRVLDFDGNTSGPWAPMIPARLLRQGLRYMVQTRIYDDRMFKAQRQGKASFYVKCTGEEAVAIAQSMHLRQGDMCFPTYRQQGLLVASDYPLLDMMCQVFSNPRDPLKGRQLPVMYSSKQHGFFTVSGNLGTQFSQAVGWAMASAYKGDDKIAMGWIGEGSTASADFHHALTFAAVYRAPVILNVVNNQWAISSFQGIAGGQNTTFASKAIGYGLPALRVDGNDYLAVYAATEWAAQRARANLGSTVIELYTYRAEGHSTSDDPSRYRPADEPHEWPLGDPIERLKDHLMAIGEWDEAQHEAMVKEVTAEIRAVQKEAEALGTVHTGSRPDPSTMFDDVYKDMPWYLERQRREAGF